MEPIRWPARIGGPPLERLQDYLAIRRQLFWRIENFLSGVQISNLIRGGLPLMKIGK